jgi:hypothetical protein
VTTELIFLFIFGLYRDAASSSDCLLGYSVASRNEIHAVRKSGLLRRVFHCNLNNEHDKFKVKILLLGNVRYKAKIENLYKYDRTDIYFQNSLVDVIHPATDQTAYMDA